MNRTEVNNHVVELLRCFLTGEEPEEAVLEEQRAAVYALAYKHDVAHLIAVVLERTGPLEGADPFLRAKRTAMYRYAKQEYERERIYTQFEKNSIAFLPLKGSVIALLYPEPWQRTGCDIDVLVRPEDLERAIHVLEQGLGCRKGKVSEHDVSLMTPGGVHLELHYDLHEQEVGVEEVWRSARPVAQGSARQELPGELFLLHHIAHMAKHFRSGGCGLRPFVDLWILEHHMEYDKAAMDRLLQERGLKSFAETVFALLELWFGSGETTPLLEAAADYILPAGVYGSMKNKVAVGQVRQGGKAGYFWSRLFQSREALEYPYPALKKHGWLLPFCQIHRWIKLLTDGKLKKIVWELGTNSKVGEDYKSDVETLLKKLGL